MTDIGHRRGATGTESGRLLSDSNMHLRPELEDQIEHTIASLIARQNRSPHARPWIGWVNEMPREILTDPIPERPGECHRLMAEVEGWLTDLGSIPAPLEWTPREIIEASDFDHVSALAEALGINRKPLPPASAILQELSSAAGNTFANAWRWALNKPPIPYDTVVREVAELEKLTVAVHEAPAAIEERIIRNRFIRILESMSPEERAELARQFELIAKEQGRTYYAEAGTGGLLVLANASGFGVYMMASTVVGAVSHALGLGLAFAFYTTMSKAISLLIPGGLAAVGALATYKLTAPNRKKMTAAVLHIGAMRAFLADKLECTKTELRSRQMTLIDRAGPAGEPQPGGKRTTTGWLRAKSWRWWTVVGMVAGAAATVGAILRQMIHGGL